MNDYIVTVYPENEDWQIVGVKANSKVEACVKAVNEYMGYEVYDENSISFNSIDELNNDVIRLGILSVDDAILTNYYF